MKLSRLEGAVPLPIEILMMIDEYADADARRVIADRGEKLERLDRGPNYFCGCACRIDRCSRGCRTNVRVCPHPIGGYINNYLGVGGTKQLVNLFYFMIASGSQEWQNRSLFHDRYIPLVQLMQAQTNHHFGREEFISSL